MRKTVPLLVLAAVLALAGPAAAEKCSIDEAPAATLLLPYFETDLVTPGLDTLFVIRNTDKNPLLANVIVWSDAGVPVFAFPIGLKAYDSYSLSLRQVLTTGTFPPSYRGTFKDCANQIPVAGFSSVGLQYAQEALTGRPVALLSGQCLGLSLPGRSNVAHGYVTIDVVKRCRIPDVPWPDYFSEYFVGKGAKPRIVSDDNRLLGQSIFFDSTFATSPMAHIEPMVHIEAFPNEFQQKSQYTFYGRLVGWKGSDKREPLATNFAVSYALGGVYGITDLFVWRDRREGPNNLNPFACGSPPVDMPQRAVVPFDEEGAHPKPPAPPGTRFFGAAAQRIDLVASGLRPATPQAGDIGWLFLNLNHGNGTFPIGQRAVAQAWVIGVVNSSPTSTPIYTGGYHAMQLDSACTGKNYAGQNYTHPNAQMPDEKK